jgi:hypothetical protein
MEKKEDWSTGAWIAAGVFLFLLILEAAFVRIEGGDRVPILSSLLDFIRRIFETILEIFRV